MFVPDKDAFEKIISLGIDLECVEGKIGDNLVFAISENELALLTASDFRIEILIDVLYLCFNSRPFIICSKQSVLYTALTHSREPQGMMTVLYYYMWWLLQNYVYNQTTNPNGGGLWRKNR